MAVIETSASDLIIAVSWHSLLMDSWQQRSEARLPVPDLKLLPTGALIIIKEGNK